MCGIVGAVAERNIVPMLMEGLRRLEYRGYDSAGIAVLNGTATAQRLRTVGKVKVLQDALDADPHARPARHRAHALGHARRAQRAQRASAHLARRSRPSSTTASSRTTKSCATSSSGSATRSRPRPTPRSIAHRIHHHLQARKRPVQGRARHGRRARGRLRAGRGRRARTRSHHRRARGLPGRHRPRRRTRTSSPRTSPRCCPSRGASCSSKTATSPRSRRDVACEISITTATRVERPVRESELSAGCRREGPVPRTSCSRRSTSSRARSPTRCRSASPTDACSRPLRAGRHAKSSSASSTSTSSRAAPATMPAASRATGSSRSAGMPCTVEIASEYRYRNPVVPPNSLFVTISQSGETADTLAALRLAKTGGLSRRRWRSATCPRARWCASPSS